LSQLLRDERVTSTLIGASSVAQLEDVKLVALDERERQKLWISCCTFC